MIWHGMSVKTISTVAAAEFVRIDRCCVRCYRTLYGKIYFVVEGALREGVWHPISPAFSAPEPALDFQAAMEEKIRLARLEDRKARNENTIGKAD